MNRKIGYLVMLSIVALLGASMLPQVTGLSTSAEGDDVIIYAMPYDFDEYSAFTQDSYATAQWTGSVYAGLVKRSSAANRDFVNDLDVSMPTVSTDGLTFTYTLRDNLRFSNGNKLTTSDIEFSFKATLTPAVNTASYGGYIGFFSNESINVIDSKTVEFTLDLGFAFPYTLMGFAIWDEQVFEDRYDRCLEGVAEDCLWNDPNGDDAIGAGPYMISDIDNVHEIVTVVANPFYYGASEMFTDKIIFQKIADKDAAVSALASGLIDILDSQYVPGLNELADLDGVSEDFVGDPSSQQIPLNHLNPYFGTGESTPKGVAAAADAEQAALSVRKAMSHVVDRKFAVDEILEGLALPAATIMPAASLGWDSSLTPRNFSVAVARNYMEAAGFDFNTIGLNRGTDGDATNWVATKTDNFFSVTVLSPNTNPARNQWSANYVLELPKIGIYVDEHVSTGWGELIPRTFGQTVLPPSYADGGYDLFFVGYGWALDWNPSALYEDVGRCDTGDCSNMLNFDLGETMTDLGDLVRAYLSELDFEARLEKVKLVQAEMFKWLPELPILYPQSHWGFSDKLSGIDPLLISTSSQEWELIKLTGFTQNVPDTVGLVDESDDNGLPVNTFAVMSAFFFTALIATYRRRT